MNFKQFTEKLNESTAELDKHISDFSKRINTEHGASHSTYGSGHSTYKNGGGKIHNMKHVSTDASHEAIFKHLQKMGYKKTSGYDPNPHKFDVHHNHDSMTSKTDPVHHPSGISAHVETEHGSRPKVHFTHRGMKEEVELEEAVTVNKKNYSWGKMMTVHHGADTSYPLHPEHQAAIKKLRPGMKTSFKDETGRQVHAHREGDDVHLVSHQMGAGTGKKTTVGYHHFDEELELDEATPYYNKPSFLKRMSRVAKQERLAREKKEAEQKKPVKEEAEQIDEAGYGRNRGYAHGFASPHAPSLGRRHREDDEGWDREPQHKPADVPHAVHINGKKWKSFGSQSHATNVAKKIKGATVHKEETIIEDAYKDAEGHLDKADKAQRNKDMFSHHMHMADHHDSLSQWHDSKGRTAAAEKHANKAADHEEMAHAIKKRLKEEVEHINEWGTDIKQHNDKMFHVINKRTGNHIGTIVTPKATNPKYRATVHRGHGAGGDLHTKEFDSAKEARAHIEKSHGIKEETELQEVLNPSMGAGEYIKDFQKSDAPQFKGKSKEKRRMMGIAAYLQAKRNVKEETELDEKITVVRDPSKVRSDAPQGRGDVYVPTAPVPDKKYIKGTPENKAAKEASKSRTGHPTNEEVEQIDEISDKTLSNYVTAARKDREQNKVNKSAADTTQRASANERDKKRIAGMNKANSYLTPGTAGYSKNQARRAANEEVEIDEAFINGREYASHGLMHPNHAKMDIHQPANREVDFYATKTGNKMQGKVIKNDGKQVHIQAHKELGDGKLHKFKVTPHLPKQQNEEVDHIDEAWKKMKVKMKEMVDTFDLDILDEEEDFFIEELIAERDEGKPGKMFHIIAAKAAKKYGSKEAGNRVAGAIRKKVLAKEELIGGQKKLDKNHNGKLDSDDFKKLRKEEKECPECHKPMSQCECDDMDESINFDNEGNLVVEKISYSTFIRNLQEIKLSDLPVRKVTGRAYGGGAQKDAPEHDEDDDKPKAKPEPAVKRGRGRPVGSKSGANQKVTSGTKRSGVDYTGYKLHLPNTNKSY